ncbi:MAG: SDR family oxidoreductase [Gammaproteobacteria bacterium]|nr:SDR family oxidoreductase [Gammaproteobacteria bacterium]
MDDLLTGKVAIITGGASGLGLATAQKFVAEGCRVVIADTNQQSGERLVAELGGNVLFKKTDVSQPAHFQSLLNFTIDHFNGLDIMVNNAGISGAVHQRFLEDDLADFHRVIDVNLFGVMLGSQHAGRYMAKQGSGSIINISSIAGIKPGLPLISYRAAKAGVIHFTKSIAREMGEYGVRVNCIAPGHIPAAQTFYDMEEMISRVQPLRRQGSPPDVANAALYLASHLSAQVTGLVLPVDGGSNLGGPLPKKV